jgi:hypothetical protein
MSSPAAIGFRAHSGWAAAVALVQASAGPPEPPVVVARRRIEMRERGASGPSQPYHAAVGLDIREARQHLETCAARAAALATSELRGMVEDLRQLGHAVAGCGLVLASGRPFAFARKDPGLASAAAHRRGRVVSGGVAGRQPGVRAAAHRRQGARPARARHLRIPPSRTRPWPACDRLGKGPRPTLGAGSEGRRTGGMAGACREWRKSPRIMKAGETAQCHLVF